VIPSPKMKNVEALKNDMVTISSLTSIIPHGQVESVHLSQRTRPKSGAQKLEILNAEPAYLQWSLDISPCDKTLTHLNHVGARLEKSFENLLQSLMHPMRYLHGDGQVDQNRGKRRLDEN
jgi:hypothetical protein